MDPSPTRRPRVLVVFESMFGNTEEIARAVALTLGQAGCDVALHEVNDPDVPAGTVDADLVVVGAPTHAFSLSRPTTRADAVRQGADAGRAGTGLREWLTAASPPADRRVPLLAFDTRVEKVRRLPLAAGPRALRLARHRGFAVPVTNAAFLVVDTAGPLVEGETARARAWIGSVLDQVLPLATAGTGPSRGS